MLKRLVPHLLEVAVVVVFALLIWSNYSLRRQQALAAAAAHQAHAFVPRDVVTEVATVELSGTPDRIDLRHGRHFIAVVDPRCDSCRGILATFGPPWQGLVVISVAPEDLTRAMATQYRLAAATHGLRQPAGSQWQIFPQIFVVDGGQVVRTCLTVAECR